MQEPSEVLIQRIQHEFTYHEPGTPEVVSRHQDVNFLFASLAHDLIHNVPEGRELSLAITALQEARMWSNAAIALNQDQVR